MVSSLIERGREGGGRMQGDKFGGKNMPGRLMPLSPSRVCCWCVEVEVFFVRWGMVGGAEIG